MKPVRSAVYKFPETITVKNYMIKYLSDKLGFFRNNQKFLRLNFPPHRWSILQGKLLTEASFSKFCKIMELCLNFEILTTSTIKNEARILGMRSSLTLLIVCNTNWYGKIMAKVLLICPFSHRHKTKCRNRHLSWKFSIHE